jgi:hypothetical protein
MPRVLFVGPGHDDFLADGLFHGLRLLLGPDAVDFPRIDHLYTDHPMARRRRLHGLGFTLAGLLGDDAAVDRDRALYRAVDGEFDLVVFADIWRTFGQWTQWMPQLRDAGVRMAVLDTSDRVEPYPYAGVWWRKRVWWTLPRIRGRAVHFKREVTPWTGWFRTYLTMPGPLAARLGATHDLRPTSFSIPASCIVDAPPDKDKDWPAHVVDPEVAARIGAQTSYAFQDAAAYHADLRRSRFGITTKKAGWDALRHYEIAAAGAVPCFRDLDRKPASAAPFGLDAGNTIIYSDAGDLLAQVARLDAQGYAELRRAALEWARRSTTEVRAREFLAACGLAVPAHEPPPAARPDRAAAS